MFIRTSNKTASTFYQVSKICIHSKYFFFFRYLKAIKKAVIRVQDLRKYKFYLGNTSFISKKSNLFRNKLYYA